MKRSYLVAAALSGMVLASGCAMSEKTAETAVGQCHGINSCKATGDCGGKTHGCHGKNSCKGKGWKKMSKADCSTKGGTFKAM